MAETQIQREKIIAVLEAERALIRGNLVEPCENPGHCAVGALLFAAGFADADMVDIPAAVDEWHPSDSPVRVLRETYGLRRRHARDLTVANDGYSDATPAQRRDDVLRCVDRMAAEQAKDPALDQIRCDDYDAEKEQWDDDE